MLGQKSYMISLFLEKIFLSLHLFRFVAKIP